jgi:hypothetical protein
LAHGIPGSGKELVAIAEGKRPAELVIPGREITRRCASVAVGQLGASQPVTHFGRQHCEAHCLIMPHETSPPTHCLQVGLRSGSACLDAGEPVYRAVRE